jgi:hypothetical protein
MRILELQTIGFRVPDDTHTFRDRDGARDLVVVTGPPRSGKSMLLRLLAGVKETFAPYGSPPDLRPLLRHGRTTGQLTATFALSDIDLERIDTAPRDRSAVPAEVRVVVNVEPSGPACSADMALLAAFAPLDTAAPITRWELFPSHRRLQIDAWNIPHPPLSASIEAGRRLLFDGDKYAVLRRVFFDLALAQATGVASALDARGIALRSDGPDLFAAYKEVLAAVAPDLRLASVDLLTGSAVPIFQRRTGERIPVSELTASEEQAALFAFASVWLGLQKAIVLIDSPELHLAPEEHVPFASRFLALGAGGQTFLATGSQAIAAMPGACVIDLGRGIGPRA